MIEIRIKFSQHQNIIEVHYPALGEKLLSLAFSLAFKVMYNWQEKITFE